MEWLIGVFVLLVCLIIFFKVAKFVARLVVSLVGLGVCLWLAYELWKIIDYDQASRLLNW